MKVDYKTFLGNLGVEYLLEPYGSQPWQVLDSETGTMCSAEVRVMDSERSEIEAEVMFQYAETTDKPINIVLWILASADAAGLYQVRKCKFKGEDFAGSIPGWQDKSCQFFRACVGQLDQGELPDIEQLEKDIMKSDGSGTGKRSRSGSGKFQKINTNMLMHDMKAGGGF